SGRRRREPRVRSHDLQETMGIDEQTFEHLRKPLYRTFQIKRFEFAASFSIVTQHVNTIDVDKFDLPCKKPHYCSIGIILGRPGERFQLHRMFTLFDWKNV